MRLHGLYNWHVAPLCKVHDDAAGCVMELERVNLPDAVVWNPWVAKAASMADFGDEEYKVCGGKGEGGCVRICCAGTIGRKLSVPLQHTLLQEMVCIEPAVAGSGAVSVPAGGSWQGKQVLRYVAQPA